MFVLLYTPNGSLVHNCKVQVFEDLGDAQEAMSWQLDEYVAKEHLDDREWSDYYLFERFAFADSFKGGPEWHIFEAERQQPI